jgi:DNA repair protein SbcC/Rad50
MLMPNALADIVFECPRCRGPIMVERTHVGQSSECPHCFDPIEVPEVASINKDKFVEPSGLRRILNEVRDREWERMRRKLRAAKAQIGQLEQQLEDAKIAAADAEITAEPAREESESLRRQLAEMNEKFALANQAFTAGRKQHEFALEKLRRDLELAREEVQTLQKKQDSPVHALRAANDELDKQRQTASVTSEEIVALRADLEWARGEARELRQQLAKVQAESEAEKAKVFLMEAAAVGSSAPGENGASGEEADSTDSSEPAAGATDAELRAQLAELQQRCASIQAVRDRAQAEVAALNERIAARDQEENSLESALTELESGIKEVVWAISARRERKA